MRTLMIKALSALLLSAGVFWSPTGQDAGPRVELRQTLSDPPARAASAVERDFEARESASRDLEEWRGGRDVEIVILPAAVVVAACVILLIIIL